jgi:tetratricopeptide (TPR) repeat protein
MNHREDVLRWFPPGDPAHMSIDNNQGLLYKLSGNYEEAKRLFEKTLPAYQAIYGDEHAKTINVLINLGAVLKDLQEFEKAVEVFEKAIEGRLKTDGESSTGYMMAKAMAAGAYRDMGQYDKADEYLRDAYLQCSL